MRFKEIKKLFETTQLDEVSMSPTNLQKFANSPEAAGMLIGIEFEMAVPNVDGSDDDDSNYEPDYSYNERCTDIGEIVNFFQEGDFSNMSRSDANRVRDDLFEEYMDWSYNAAEDYINDNDDELMSKIRSRLDDEEVDRDEVAEEAHTRWVEENPDGEPTSEEASEEIRNLTLQMIEDRLDAMMEDTDSSEYQNAYDTEKQEMEDEFRNSGEGDQEAWLSYISVEDMQDASRHWGLDWPHMEDTNYNNGGVSIETVADEFAEAMGLSNVNSSSNYHGARRDGKSWCIEPDGSIDHDDDEAGLEFISPPLPLKDGLEQMTKMIAWAKDKGCTTNSSTGLHMNISVPDYNFDHLDFVKLALFMGDEHILEQFGRTYNNFCKSALKIVKEKIDKEGVAGPLLQAMRDHLNVAASKAVHNGSTQKYTSINTQTGYVEFRGPGGDYLNQDITQLISTALRLAQSLRIATDESAHKQEYAKKLYKLVVPTDKDTDDDNSVAMFTRYAMGQIKKDDLLYALRQSQSNRKAKKFPNGPKREWTVMRKSNPGYKVSFNATSAAEALQLAKNQIGGWAGVADEHFKVTADATGDSAYNKAREEHYLSTMDPVWQKFIRDIATVPTERLKQRKAELEAEAENAPLGEWKKIAFAKINNELATRKDDVAATGAVDDIEELPQQHREFARDIQNKTEAGLNSIKAGLEAGDFSNALTNIQASIFLGVVVNEIARRAGLTADMADLDGFVNTLGQTSTWQLYNSVTDEVLATYTGLTQGQAIDRRAAMRSNQGNENIEMRNLGSAEQSTAQANDTESTLWDNWIRTLPTRNTESINSFRDQIRSGQHNNTLPTEHERDVVIIHIDDELRRRMARGEGSPFATYTIYDGTGRVVNTIRATSAAMALDTYGDNFDIDTTHYTARPTVQQAADHVIPEPAQGPGQSTYSNYADAQAAADSQNAAQRPGPGQSRYTVEHIPSGAVMWMIGNDAADAIQRVATATGDNPSNFRIAQTAPATPAQDEQWNVGNHTYGREIIRAPNREEAIRLFAHNNNISVDDVTSGPSFIANQLTDSTNESIDLIRKLAGLK